MAERCFARVTMRSGQVIEKSFREYSLQEEIVGALDALGYRVPTAVQDRVIPVALAGRDMAVKSRTGSGKTAAFGIPICERVDWLENRPQALVLVPTRELAQQVKEDITNIGRLKRIKVSAVYGKQPFAPQKAELSQKCHVVVGTPGRVLDHIERGTLALDRLRYLVIDEADEMLGMGFLKQVEAILEALPRDRITLLFSATLPRDVQRLCFRYMTDPVSFDIEEVAKVGSRHLYFVVDDDEKFSLLTAVTVTLNPDHCLVFCRTKERVDSVFDGLRNLAYPCGKVHGGMEQEDRTRTMNQFRRGDFRYLVATDVAARGIDIEKVTHVINYDLPVDKESYVHRTGRTGRGSESGTSVTFSTSYEEKFLAAIESYAGVAFEKMVVPDPAEVTARRAAFLDKLGGPSEPKKIRGDQVHDGIVKLYFNGGKSKKIRAVDLVGTIAKIEGVEATDIGIITIQDNISYVDILHGKGRLVLEAMQATPVKGKLLKVSEARQN